MDSSYEIRSYLHSFCVAFGLGIVTLIIISCSKSELYSTAFGADFHAALYEEVYNRHQIISFVDNYGIVNIKFSGGIEFRIDNKQIPLWKLNGMNSWQVDEDNTGVLAERDSLGNVLFPDLSVVDNQWYINGQASAVYPNKEYINAVSNLPNGFIAIAMDSKSLMFYTYDGRKFRNTIIYDKSLVVPSYFHDHLLSKEHKAESIINDQGRVIESYVFFTDAHWGSNQKHSPSIIKHVLDFGSIDRVFFGGDAITSYCDDPADALQVGRDFMKSFSFVGKKLYCVVGNHDDNATGQPSKIENHLSDEQVYSYLQGQMTDVFYGPYHNFYLDSPNTKTRFLCLDTGRLYLSSKRDHSIQTAEFAISSLDTVPEGWHVVAVSHIWTNLVSSETGECKESPYIKPIIDILEDYNSRISGVFTHDNDIIEYDFSDAKGRVEYCIGGHTHADYIVKSEGGIPLITLTCDGRQQVAGVPSVRGTISEQCVAIIITDYTDRLLHIIHIGRGEDSTISI